MSKPVLGLACIALTASTVSAYEPELQLGTEGTPLLVVSGELLNEQFTNGVTRHDDVTGHGRITARWWDVGVHIDGYMALDSGPTKSASNFETTEITGRLDYLIEWPGYFQILPFLETTVYPDINGKTPFNWAGGEGWALLPWEGIEVGGFVEYNLYDGENQNSGLHHWNTMVGGRQFWQDAPLDLAFWELIGLANHSYHLATSGVDHTGLTYLNLGMKVTLPLPWEDLWTFLRVEDNIWLDHKDREGIRAAGADSSEFVIGIGVEYRG